ncbi:MAG: acyclic terpene utilization AtuA family protein [Pseudomonadota bacterium]
MKKVVIGSGSAFWGDMLEPAVEMAERSDVQYIGFDHLAELTMAILNRMKAKNPEAGYIPDIIPWMKRMLPATVPKGIKMITNAGGANPVQAAKEVAKVVNDLNLGRMKIGVVYGDDILPYMNEIRAQGWKFKNLDTGEEDIDRIRKDIIAANAYIGADLIIKELNNGADMVIAGRVSDNALYVGPLMYEFGWDFTDEYIDRVAAAVTVGHIIECAACVTGGMSNMWQIAEKPWEIGFPIAEVNENGDAVITKTPGSGGVVNEWTVKEHLLYEIMDPANYMMPDGIADFSALHLSQEAKNRVRVTDMKGKKRPDTLKVCIGYRDGFIGEGLVFFPWPDALEKARYSEKWIRGRFEKLGVHFKDLRIDYIGMDMLHGEAAPVEDKDFNEIGLRIVGRTNSYEEALVVRREATHLWTAGPVGVSFGVPLDVRPVIALWPSLVPREAVKVESQIMEVGS